jgi:hypothetical protein
MPNSTEFNKSLKALDTGKLVSLITTNGPLLFMNDDISRDDIVSMLIRVANDLNQQNLNLLFFFDSAEMDEPRTTTAYYLEDRGAEDVFAFAHIMRATTCNDGIRSERLVRGPLVKKDGADKIVEFLNGRLYDRC